MEEHKWTLLKAISKTGISKYLYLIMEAFSAEEWASPQMEECLHLAARLGFTLVPNPAIIQIWRFHSLIQEPLYEKNHLDVVRFIMTKGVKVCRNFIKYRAHLMKMKSECHFSILQVSFTLDSLQIIRSLRAQIFSQEEDFNRGMFQDLMPRRNWVEMSRVVRETIDYAVQNDDTLKMRLIIKHVPLEKLSKGLYLHLAIVDGSRNVAELLIRAGVDINAVNDFGTSPLDLAIQCFDNTIVSLLLKKCCC